jgi:hypothetical protein
VLPTLQVWFCPMVDTYPANNDMYRLYII